MPAARQIDVFLLPVLAQPEELTGRTVVVIDVLRATTTIVQALASGATQVIPCQEIADARNLAIELPRPLLLGGERGGKQIPGFDLGNSPSEYSRDVVAGKTIVFSTTNGTRAMLRCKAAGRVLIGSFLNFSALCRELEPEERIALVCAGTDGHVTREDTLLAGAIVDDLCRSAPRERSQAAGRGSAIATPQPPGTYELNDQAEIAADAWQNAVRVLTDRPLGLTLRDSRGGRNLIEIGQENDIDLASQIDKFDIVPELDLASWRIRLGS
jgi:2-phosphosulfolactate phosphatase